MKFMVVVDVEPDDPTESMETVGDRLEKVLEHSMAREAIREAIQDGMRAEVKLTLIGQLVPADSEEGYGLREFAEQLESGAPIPCKLVSQEQTPDGPITTITDAVLKPGKPDL